ncbi:hypothetical protein BVC80_1835g574 [Macleaya cordata]|uniref:Uncharacterized protein n=1 Tax=Macleaya cordata TaxID=56857 RepID=A0A200R614_MACCD|nr:hypothetical protein BVC80_1835g574 [Macleaya cordata]
MEMISLWWWLEDVGYPNLILKMAALPNEVVNALAEEALASLHCIVSEIPPPPPHNSITQLLITLTLLDGNYISLEYLHQNRERALTKILTSVNMVCTSVFQDIVQQALLLFSNQPSNNPDQLAGRMTVTNPTVNVVGPGTGPGPAAPLIQQQQQQQHVDVQLQPIIVFGSGITSGLNPLGTATGVYGGAGGIIFETGEGSSSSITAPSTLNPMAEPWAPPTHNVINSSNAQIAEEEEEVIPVPEDDRTLFLTFSRGYPITERDVLDFFVLRYGDCVENIYLQQMEGNKQPLHARVVFYSASKISEVLEGKQRVNFTINGRHKQRVNFTINGRHIFARGITTGTPDFDI